MSATAFGSWFYKSMYSLDFLYMDEGNWQDFAWA